MNFLNPLVLMALGAAILPLIIHFLSKKKPKEIPFPSVLFLKTLQSDRLRFLKFKQILMLLLRTLIILFLVLAFARPALKSFFKKDSAISAVIVIDNSASMSYIDNGEPIYEKALRKAAEITGSLRRMDLGSVIIAGREPYIIGQGLMTNKDYLTAQLKNVRNSFGENNPSAVFSAASEILKSSGSPNKEIYYLTDLAANSFPESLMSFGENTRLYIVPLGPEKRDESVIENIDLENKIIAPGRETIFKVRGVLGESQSETEIEFFVDGERKGLKKVTGRPSESLEIDFSYIPDTFGLKSVYAKAGEGSFDAGEIRRMIMKIPGNINVLIIGSDEKDYYYIDKALAFARNDSLLSAETILEKQVTPEQISVADVVILAGVEDLSDLVYRELLSLVMEKGKGLILFPDKEFRTKFYAGRVYRDIFPLSNARRVDVPEGVTINRLDLSHNSLSGISDSGDFYKPVARSYLSMTPVEEASVIAGFSDGSPAIWESECGRGKIIVFGFDASTDMSDLPLSGVFMPMIMQFVRYLSDTEFLGGTYVTGDTIEENAAVQSNSKVTIKPEDSAAYMVNPYFLGNKVLISGIRAGKPGFYSIEEDGKELSRFCVNTPVSEIVYKKASSGQLKRAFGAQRWRVLDNPADIVNEVNKDRFGRELSGLFLMISLALLFVEMAVSKRV